MENVTGAEEKFIQTLVRDRKALFKKGTAAVGFCNKKETELNSEEEEDSGDL